MTTGEGTDVRAARPRSTRSVRVVAMVLALGLIASLVGLLALWRRAEQLAAERDEAEANAEQADEQAIDDAYDAGFAAGWLQAKLAAKAELNPTARAAMESAWGAMDGRARDYVCLGLDLELLSTSHFTQATESLPGVTADQLEAYFAEQCENRG